MAARYKRKGRAQSVRPRGILIGSNRETTVSRACRVRACLAQACCWSAVRFRVAHWDAARARGPRAGSHATRQGPVLLNAEHQAPAGLPLLDAHCWRVRSSVWRPRCLESQRSSDDHFGQRSCRLEMHCPGDPRDGPLDDPCDEKIQVDRRDGPLRGRSVRPPRRGGSRRVARWPPLPAGHGSPKPTASDPIAPHVRARPALSSLQSGARAPRSFRVRWDAPEFRAARRCS